MRNPLRAFTVPIVAQYLIYAGYYAAFLGGRLGIGDISGPTPGPFAPHKSHQQGRDADVAYTLNGDFPTPTDVPMSPDWVNVMHALAPWLEVVFMSKWRREQYQKVAPQALVPGKVKITDLAGHDKHAHFRFRIEGASLVRANNDDGC